MHNKHLISILIIAYNPGEYLRKTLESCLDQTYPNTEILILDNASNEDLKKSITGLQDYRITEIQETGNESTFEFCQNIKPSNCKTVKLYQSSKNLGPYGGLNYLLEKTQGSYVAIQDHDDIWHPEKLEKQITFLETHLEYVGCGTNTIMYYESDQKYFKYFLGEENYYTIHPSLLFRNDGKFRYDTSGTEYMCDAWSLKNNLCHGKKKIANLAESLTLHLIKKGSTNYSYKWYKLSLTNIKHVYNLHSPLYATFTLLWEIKRKFWYPILQKIGLGKWIDTIERIPFRLMGKEVKKMRGDEWWKEYLQD